MTAPRILIAGIGNVFLGDDAFGVETVQQLLRSELPENVRAVDFGIRSYDLAYAIAEGYDVVVLVDAAPRGAEPGTVYLITPDQAEISSMPAIVNGHSLTPVSALQLASAFEVQVHQCYLVGCEPAVFELEDGQFGLSASVAAAVPQAVALIQTLIGDLNDHRNPVDCARPKVAAIGE